MKRGKSTDRGYMLVGGRLTDDYGLGLLFQSQNKSLRIPDRCRRCSMFLLLHHNSYSHQNYQSRRNFSPWFPRLTLSLLSANQ